MLTAQRLPLRSLVLVLGLAVALVVAIALVVFVWIGRESATLQPVPGPPPGLVSTDGDAAAKLLRGMSFRAGEWMPSQYFGPEWEKYQAPAVAAAALGTSPGGTAAQRNEAIETVNAAIVDHQQSDGDFDAGTAFAGGSSVSGGFWVESEGLIAITLRQDLDSATLRRWERSLARYVQFLVRSGSSDWYSNGNVVLRQAVIMLETYRLARWVRDPEASTYLQDYRFEKRFLVHPSATSGGGWRTYGEYENGHGGLWFDESPFSNPRAPIQCANHVSPCRGFDPNYTAVQLNDAILALKVGGDNGFWRHIVSDEYAVLRPRISDGTLNASNGSRDDIPTEPFYAPVYSVLGAGSPARAWREQTSAVVRAVEAGIRSGNPSENEYGLLEPLGLAMVRPA